VLGVPYGVGLSVCLVCRMAWDCRCAWCAVWRGNVGVLGVPYGVGMSVCLVCRMARDFYHSSASHLRTCQLFLTYYSKYPNFSDIKTSMDIIWLIIMRGVVGDWGVEGLGLVEGGEG